MFPDPQEGLDAIRSFAEECVRQRASAQAVTAPAGVSFEASMPNGGDVVEAMAGAGWTRTGEVEFAVELESWRDSREPLAAAMNAALAPFLPYWLGGFAGPDEAGAADQERVAQLRLIFDAWAAESQPEWYTEPADPFPGRRRRRLAADSLALPVANLVTVDHGGAEILDVVDPGLLRDRARLGRDDPELEPERAGADRDRLFGVRGRELGTAEDVDEVDRTVDLRERPCTRARRAPRRSRPDVPGSLRSPARAGSA